MRRRNFKPTHFIVLFQDKSLRIQVVDEHGDFKVYSAYFSGDTLEPEPLVVSHMHYDCHNNGQPFFIRNKEKYYICDFLPLRMMG